MIARERGFAAVVILTLALGIGANTAIFSVVNSVLLRPLPYPESDRLVAVNEVIPKVAHMYPTLPVNLAHYFLWQNHLTSFDSMLLARTTQMNLTGAGDPVVLDCARISANAFAVLGVQPRIGRAFTEAEERDGQDQVAILSHTVWTERFNSDPGVIGRKIMLDGHPRVVVGVLPAGFRFPRQSGFGGTGSAAEKLGVYIPLGYSNDDLKDLASDFNWVAIGRLKRGVSVERAATELNVVQAQLSKTLPDALEVRGAVEPMRDAVVGDSRRGLVVIMSAVLAVLLVLCVNLANLWFARAAGHGRDLAIRVALGASRAQLMRQMLVESMTLAVIGGALGTLMAYAALGALLRLAPANLPRLAEARMDGVALAFALGASMLSGLVFGILPALRMARQDPQEALKSGSHANTEGTRGVWVRKALVTAEVALSCMLLIGAGLLVRSFERLMSIDRGFDIDRVLAADVALPGAKYTKPEQRTEFFRRLLEKAQSMPGVQSVGLVSALPLQGETWVDVVGNEHDRRPAFQRPVTNVRFISPDYFKTLAIPMRSGRTFDDSDKAKKVAIISQSVAARLFPGQEAVGRKIQHNDSLEEIVGVTPDIRSTSLDHDPVNMLYIPYWQRPRLQGSLLIRTAMDPTSITGAVRMGVRELDAEVPAPEMRTMVEVMNKSVGQRRFQMELLLVFAVSALALASFGVYGVLAYSVTRRTNEIGIRMALGAGASEVRRMVLSQALQPVLAGLVLGIAGALAMGQVLQSLLFQVEPRDPMTIVLVAGVLCATAVVACLLPARRATRVDPLRALRCD